MTSFLVSKIWPFYEPGYWDGYLGASRPLLLCVTLSQKTVKILPVKGLKAKNFIKISLEFSLSSCINSLKIHVFPQILECPPWNSNFNFTLPHGTFHWYQRGKGVADFFFLEKLKYRGLSIGSTVCKLIINIILNRIKPWYENQLTDEQNGFRSNRGTTDGISTVKRVRQITSKKK